MRIGNWLTADQGKRLLAAFGGEDLRSKRDYAMIAVLLGCGLRRAEVAGLAVEDLQQREEHWVIADLVGKGGHVRTVPVPTWVKVAVDDWLTAAGISTGPVFRAINKAQPDREKRFQSESHMGRRQGRVRKMWSGSRCAARSPPYLCPTVSRSRRRA